MDLGAWVTLANGNGVGFPAAHTQVVAGRVNRESGDVEPIDAGGPILAQCWPRGSTSDSPAYLQIVRASAWGVDRNGYYPLPMAAPAAALKGDIQNIVVTAQRKVAQEQLGDLKLYRVPDRTTVASRQSKQVRLLDRQAIPIHSIYSVDLAANDADLMVNQNAVSVPASRLLRTMNNTANHLGLPLPSGRVAVFATHREQRLLERESGMRDLAVDEEVEINMGASPDVEVTMVRENSTIDPVRTRSLPLVPGLPAPRSTEVDDVNRVEISNARETEIRFELRLQLPEGARVIRADHLLGRKNGRPIFRLTIPAHATATVRYQWQHTVG